MDINIKDFRYTEKEMQQLCDRLELARIVANEYNHGDEWEWTIIRLIEDTERFLEELLCEIEYEERKRMTEAKKGRSEEVGQVHLDLVLDIEAVAKKVIDEISKKAVLTGCKKEQVKRKGNWVNLENADEETKFKLIKERDEFAMLRNYVSHLLSTQPDITEEHKEMIRGAMNYRIKSINDDIEGIKEG